MSRLRRLPKSDHKRILDNGCVCPLCKHWNKVQPQSESFSCRCDHAFYFVNCPECGAAQSVQAKIRQSCSECGHRLVYPQILTSKPFSAWSVGDHHSHIEPPKGKEIPEHFLGPLIVLDGAGWAPPIGSAASLSLYFNRITIIGPRGESVVPLASVQDVRVQGASVTTGGGFIGGGFGAKGAVEGMLISSVLNSLTTKSRKWVTIAIVADRGWVEVQLNDYEAISVRATLRALADAVIANQTSETPDHQVLPLEDGEVDFVSSLDRLVAHRDSGALSEDEFQAAKQRLLYSQG